MPMIPKVKKRGVGIQSSLKSRQWLPSGAGKRFWFDTQLLRAKYQVKLAVEGLSVRKAAEQIGVHHTTLLRFNSLDPDVQTTLLICAWVGAPIESFVRSI